MNRLLILLAFLFVLVFGLNTLLPSAVTTSFAGAEITAPEVVRVQPLSALEYPKDSPYNLLAPIASRVGMETRLGNPQIPARGGEVWLQIALRAQDAQRRQNIASNVMLTLIPAQDIRVVQILGYADVLPSKPVSLQLPELWNSDARVVLVQLDAAPTANGTRTLAHVELRYTDSVTQRAEIFAQSVTADFLANANPDPLVDIQVMHHVTHQRAVQGAQEIERMSQNKKYLDAWNLAAQLEYESRRVAQLTHDARIAQDAETMRAFQNKLAQSVQTQNGFYPKYISE